MGSRHLRKKNAYMRIIVPSKKTPATAQGVERSTASVPLGCVIIYPGSNILNVIRSKFFTKGRHRVFAVGYLVLDGFNIVTSSQILLDCFLLDFFLGDDTVVATGMTSSTVGTENSLTVFQVCCHHRAAPCHSCQQAQCKAQGKWIPRDMGRNLRLGVQCWFVDGFALYT